MTCVASDAASLATTGLVAIGDNSNVLDAIGSAACALAIWRRRPPKASILLANLSHAELDDIDVLVPVREALLHLALHLGAAGYPVPAGVALAEDAGMLVARHAAVAREDWAKVRIEWIKTDACCRFHADAVTTRLLTTYVGHGTEWRLAHSAGCEPQRASAGEVLILKGRRLLPDTPILHRSPPIARTGDCRLLLVIDSANFGA